MGNKRDKMRTVIENVRIVKEDNILSGYKLLIEDDIISKIYKGDLVDKDIDLVIDGRGYYLGAGFIDLHSHGAMGYDVADISKNSIEEISKFHIKNGSTSFLATIITSSKEDTFRAIENLVNYQDDSLLGIYLEGPFFSREKKGAQPEEYIIEPDLKYMKDLLEACKGKLKVVSLAPELKDIDKIVDYLLSNSIRVALGHSRASYIEAKNILDRGASLITHIYNGMSSFNHREPGILGAGLMEDVFAEIIYDRIHIHDVAFKLAYKLKGREKLLFISDSMMAAGLGSGKYLLGGQDVYVEDGQARLLNGDLAGSLISVRDGVYNSIAYSEINLVDGIYMGSLTPAKALGLDKMYGSIEEGKYANLILFDEGLSIKKTIIKGSIRWEEKEK